MARSPGDPEHVRFWFSRLRWRIRGGSVRLSLLVAFVADVLLLAWFPALGDGYRTTDALVLALAINVVIFLFAASLGTELVRKRDPSLPQIVARDRAIVLGLFLGIGILVAGGIVNRPGRLDRAAKVEAIVDSARELARSPSSSGAKPNLDKVDLRRWNQNRYRVCFDLPGSAFAWCAWVSTVKETPTATRDDDQRSNAVVARDRDVERVTLR